MLSVRKSAWTQSVCIAAAAMTLAVVAAPAAAQGNKELMSIRMAQAMATRGITESIVGLKVRSQEVFFSDRSGETSVDTKIQAAVKGVKHGRPKYDAARDIAISEATITLGDVRNVIGKPVSYNNVTVRRIGLGTNTESSRPFLQALRAAEIDAYDQLARTIVGQQVDSRSRTENLVLVSDEVRTSVMAAIWGAEVKDYGWTEDGNAFVKMTLDVRYAKDVFGNRIKYTGPNVIEVTGQGAQRDDTRASMGQPGQPGRLYDPVDLKLPTGAPVAVEAPQTGGSVVRQ
ncbi:LPP20 lipoprotein [Stella humosa]|uniref:LPP20 lipoprotein n=1 Tax=Stella humosa TaxID=94 RepID=A0A3N1KZE5_9PROT|nr:hypothetical protein [Stella humosa]ROP83688.1 LPP20 lipoprotein [Stella humosa]BBK33040.1 hypothetical protein STHU_36740 [Stella humosa]